MRERRFLLDRIESGLLWGAAFALACGVFLSLSLLFKALPPTAPVAIGYVTITGASKLRDYVGLALFLLLVPLLTVWLQRWGLRLLRKEQSRVAWHGAARDARGLAAIVALLFTAPLFLSPLFYLTTGKWGWILVLPAVLAFTGPALLRAWLERRAIRELFAPAMAPFHALLFGEALAWILFRYIVTGRRIAHFPTLFLEVVFLAVFLALFWCVAFYAARLTMLLFGSDWRQTFQRITVGAMPILLLPFIALVIVPLPSPRLVTLGALVLCATLVVTMKRPVSGEAAWRIAAFLALPALVYLISYATTAHPAQWVDLFHRGESIGPASDYLRGKVPYRDVFVLHGMMEDGLLDAWLMEIFGRDLTVAVWRSVLLGSLLGVSLWYLGIAIFRSIPLAMLVVAMGAWTTAENNRTFFQIAAVALFWAGLRYVRPVALIASGVVAAIALFFSYEIGLYTIAGAIGSCVLVAIAQRRTAWEGMRPLRALAFFMAGVIGGAAPFVAYLASHGALADFAEQSFLVIPRVIDAVWSLPFPDLVSTFRGDVTINTFAEFFLSEKFHLVLSPLAIALALAYIIQRWAVRRLTSFDYALLVITVFAAAAQRTAIGRAEFRHQYFAAFLIGPLLVMLGIIVSRAVRATWRDGGDGTRAFLALLAVASLPVLALMFWIPDLVNVRIDDLTRYVHRVSGNAEDGRAREIRWRVEALANEIAKLTRRGDAIYDFSNQPALYFFADRANPTRFYQVPIASPREFQAETIRALEKARPRVVLRRSPDLFDSFDGVPNHLRAQAIAGYIDDTYRFHRAIRGVEIWTRIKDARPATTEAYLRRIRMPKPAELQSATARLVFPAVGSLPGVGGSYWVSELTLHNPFREPLILSLRYVAGDTRLDRRITLAARQTMRWPDVVKTLFRAPDSIGALWVEHPGGRAPVAVVKTWDMVGRGQVAVESPLGMNSAVAAGGDLAELTIVGFPEATGGRRINIGVVNVGIIPATFRITARTRNGVAFGKPIEAGIPEDEVWLVRDVERDLGVQIDENTTIRITAIAGTGVGFATIVDPAGANEFIAAIPTQQE